MSELEQNRPLVSIVVPVYNASGHLVECIDSILGQTYENIELICVDDGSTDDSSSILREYSGLDERVRVLSQGNAGPGVARNTGMDAAKGEYLYFLDSDDCARPNLVNTCVEVLEETQADMAAFEYEEYYASIESTRLSPWAKLYDKFPGDVVSWQDNPDWLFQAFQNLPWNKFFKLAFLRDNDIRFQEIHLTEDLMFAAPALALAKGIAIIRKPLVCHRMGTLKNAMADKDAYPLDFISAFKELRAFLESRGLFGSLGVSYKNWAASGCQYNLQTVNTHEGFAKVHEALNSHGLSDMGLLPIPEDEIQEPFHVDFLRELTTMDANDYLMLLYVGTREGCDVRELHIENLVRDWTAAKDEAVRLRGKMEELDADNKRLYDALNDAIETIEAIESAPKTRARQLQSSMGVAVRTLADAGRHAKKKWIK